MAQRDQRPTSQPMTTQLSDFAKATSRSSLSPLPNRPLSRAATFIENHPLRKRRSSTFSESASSLKSSTDNLLLPRAKSAEKVIHHDSSHWHSVPLALALLPAIGGLLFEKGSAIITDLTLLALAAVFLNWSVRLPWDWYHSAQVLQVQEVPMDQPSYRDNDTIIEEGSEEEGSLEASGPTTPAVDNKSNHLESAIHEPPAQSPSQSSSGAASELRVHELLALLTCFVSPLIGSWLLHHIRDQLSRPSEGLVSNYNLTIFVMAAELRPLSHLIKLVQARTLYLQRVVSCNPHQTSSSLTEQDTIDELTHRISELESQLPTTPNGTPKSPNINPAQQQQDLIAATRKTLQPDVDALNRAVRRYEKRATLLTMQTESRLQGLESKLADAITLAAAAERSSQASKQRRGSGVVMMLDWATSAVLIPLQLAWTVVSLPGKLVLGVVSYVEEVVRRKYKREMRTAGRAPDGSKLGVERRKMGRGAKKVM